jgi:hypothetical protein
MSRFKTPFWSAVIPADWTIKVIGDIKPIKTVGYKCLESVFDLISPSQRLEYQIKALRYFDKPITTDDIPDFEEPPHSWELIREATRLGEFEGVYLQSTNPKDPHRDYQLFCQDTFLGIVAFPLKHYDYDNEANLIESILCSLQREEWT